MVVSFNVLYLISCRDKFQSRFQIHTPFLHPTCQSLARVSFKEPFSLLSQPLSRHSVSPFTSLGPLNFSSRNLSAEILKSQGKSSTKTFRL